MVNLELKQGKDSQAGVNNAIVYTDGSIMYGQRSGWGFTTKVRGRVITEHNGIYQTNSSMRMEIQAVTAVLRWLYKTSVAKAIIVYDSWPMLRRVRNGWLSHKLLPFMRISKLQEFAWIYCLGHAGVHRNEWAYSLASRSPPYHLKMARVDILWEINDVGVLWNIFWGVCSVMNDALGNWVGNWWLLIWH